MSDPHATLVLPTMKGDKMFKATLTFQDPWSGEYVRTVEHEDQGMFFARIIGTIQGNLACNATLIAMDRGW
jgi:hypothetical protein